MSGGAWWGVCMMVVCMAGGVHDRMGMHDRGHVWQGACISGGHGWQGHVWPGVNGRGGMCGRGHA